MERLFKILQSIRGDVDFINEKKLVDDDLIDSIDILQIISEICDEYDIDIPKREMIPENFNSIESIYELVCRCLKK